MSFMRRLMTQKIGSTFIPFEDIFLGYGIAITITAPTGCDTANIRMWGAGGGGGVQSGGTNGGGGGGGGFTIKKGISVTGGSSTFTCNVSTGGFGRATAGTGGTGGNTTISGTVTLISTGGSGGTSTTNGAGGLKDASGDIGSEDGQAGGTGGISGGNTGGLSFLSSGYGIGGDVDSPQLPTPPGAGGGGGTRVTGPPLEVTPSQSGARGQIKIRWTKSGASNTVSYSIYNTPMTFIATTAPSYPTCAIQQIYTTNVRDVWEAETAAIQSISFVRQFIANTSTSTCDYDQTNSSLSLRIRQNGLTQLPQNFFTSIITPTGASFNSADATYDYDNLGGTPTYDTIWTWYNVADGIINTGTNLNVRFKV